MYFLKNFLNYFFGAVLKITKLRRVNHWAAFVNKNNHKTNVIFCIWTSYSNIYRKRVHTVLTALILHLASIAVNPTYKWFHLWYL